MSAKINFLFNIWPPYAQPLVLVVLTFRTFNDFEDHLWVFTMYQVLPETFTQANIPLKPIFWNFFSIYIVMGLRLLAAGQFAVLTIERQSSITWRKQKYK